MVAVGFLRPRCELGCPITRGFVLSNCKDGRANLRLRAGLEVVIFTESRAVAPPCWRFATNWSVEILKRLMAPGQVDRDLAKFFAFTQLDVMRGLNINVEAQPVPSGNEREYTTKNNRQLGKIA